MNAALYEHSKKILNNIVHDIVKCRIRVIFFSSDADRIVLFSDTSDCFSCVTRFRFWFWTGDLESKKSRSLIIDLANFVQR